MLRDDPSDRLARTLADMIVGDMMQRWPESVPVLLRHRLACPGCLMARFMTVHEAAIEHGVEPDLLLDELAAAIAATAVQEPAT